MLAPLAMSNELHYWFTAKTRSSVAGSRAELAWQIAVCLAFRVSAAPRRAAKRVPSCFSVGVRSFAMFLDPVIAVQVGRIRHREHTPSAIGSGSK